MTHLARKLRLVDYFALGFGVMVGTAWLVVMDDILKRGGSLGAILGFTAGALILLPIGYVYGQLIRAIPDAARRPWVSTARAPTALDIPTEPRYTFSHQSRLLDE